MPYNSPDYGEDPKLWLDFVSDQTDHPEVNPTTKNLDKDVFDRTFW